MDSRAVRAIFDDATIRVYQAYPAEIAIPALRHGRFVAPFKMERMTWIKPSFNWMMYRCGYATKPGQDVVLGIDITREGFEWALRNAALSHFTPAAYDSPEVWRAAVDQTPVRIQWDPERDWRLNPIAGVRSLQVGLSADAVSRYVNRWIVGIADINSVGRLAAQAAASGAAPPALPCDDERSYPLAIRASGLLQP
ncbi:DUF4291 domain-containing protein [Reyranella sp. CPCC 100927]|nr:DUF4291 domain-containing protein [Reyranella sp. CPCC 100927]